MTNTTTPQRLIKASHIGLKEGEKTLLDDISLSISEGEIITIIGPNGAGKTTLLNILLGLRSASSGTVERLSSLRIGYVPQSLQLNPQLPLTVERFLSLANLSSASPFSPMSIDAALDRTSVAHLKQSDMNNLSGGEKQRVLISRALLRRPQLLALDEPVQGIDINGQNQLYQLIRELRDELQCGILMISHDLHLVMAATDHVICLNQHICCCGHPESVSNHPEYLKLFGEAAKNLATYTHHHNHHHNLHGEVIDDEHASCQHGDH